MASNQMTGIVLEDVKLPDDQKKRLAFVLHNVLTPQECQDYIDKTEKQGYIQAKVNIGGGREMTMTDVRNNDRCIIDSFEESGNLWQRIKAYIPSELKGRRVLGLNERLRFLRYEPGQYFKPHFDGSYIRDNAERSYITVQLYLNEGFNGGSTTFLHKKKDQRCEVVPKTGSVLIFQHAILHEGSMLNEGRKYAMRTDVMFSAEAKSHSTDQQLES